MKNLFSNLGRLVRAMGAKSARRHDSVWHVTMLPQRAVVSGHTARMPGSARRARAQAKW